jgi:hypothetical protein
MNKHRYYTNCVAWDPTLVRCKGGLIGMIDNARTIERSSFVKHVDKADLRNLERLLGYEEYYKKGLTMAADWHVSYHSSRLFGSLVYYFRHSGIEYVFVKHEEPT